MEILNFNLSNSKNDSKKTKKINFLKVKTNRIYLPWVEKYRPSVLSEVILDDITKHKMEQLLMILGYILIGMLLGHLLSPLLGDFVEILKKNNEQRRSKNL